MEKKSFMERLDAVFELANEKLDSEKMLYFMAYCFGALKGDANQHAVNAIEKEVKLRVEA